MIDRKFLIKYSYVGYTSRKDIQKLKMFNKEKISQCYYEHSCELSDFYNQAMHT